MMLLILALALANDDPADWGCADPLIAKNWMQRVGDVALAARIKDECVRPFVEDTSQPIEVLRIQKRTIYLQSSRLFQAEIQAKILARRRKRDIPLNR